MYILSFGGVICLCTCVSISNIFATCSVSECMVYKLRR